ncbi:hypothetical protein AeMF1_015896 [Aphanomyces euteiches]|nr:hypothetical protein AeMF1_015896 [Aphanomyces euteiches]KAH9183874.1 hypothetical protein AeNC1_014149 [Aphanomyces euteiches]
MKGDQSDKTKDDSGLPVVPANDAKRKYGPLATLTVGPLLLGISFAYAIYYYGNKAMYDYRMEKLYASNLFWGCAAVVVLGRVGAFVNCYPLVHKGCFLTTESSQLWFNPFFYRAIGKDAPVNTIVLDPSGVVGCFNRANRCVYDVLEMYTVLLAGLCLASAVFALPVLILTGVFSLGWILHVMGLTNNNRGHGLGYILAAAATTTIEGMLALIVLKACTAPA